MLKIETDEMLVIAPYSHKGQRLWCLITINADPDAVGQGYDQFRFALLDQPFSKARELPAGT
jgi:hypothetical protein